MLSCESSPWVWFHIRDSLLHRGNPWARRYSTSVSIWTRGLTFDIHGWLSYVNSLGWYSIFGARCGWGAIPIPSESRGGTALRWKSLGLRLELRARYSIGVIKPLFPPKFPRIKFNIGGSWYPRGRSIIPIQYEVCREGLNIIDWLCMVQLCRYQSPLDRRLPVVWGCEKYNRCGRGLVSIARCSIRGLEE